MHRIFICFVVVFIGAASFAVSEDQTSTLLEACNLHDGEKCFDLGIQYFENANISKALHFTEKACELDVASACRAAAGVYARGQQVPQDFPKAEELALRSCAKSDSQGCRLVGELLQQNNAPTVDVLSFFDKACVLGDAEGCFLGSGLSFQINDLPYAFASANRACELDHSEACHTVAVMYLEGIGVTADVQQGNLFLGIACERGKPESCGILSDHLREGFGLTANVEQSLEFGLRACEGGLALSCRTVGIMYATGSGIPSSFDLAALYFSKACTHGDQPSCNELANLESQAGL